MLVIPLKFNLYGSGIGTSISVKIFDHRNNYIKMNFARDNYFSGQHDAHKVASMYVRLDLTDNVITFGDGWKRDRQLDVCFTLKYQKQNILFT